MRFVLYTEKTVSQCMTAINERMHVKATSTRPALDGWVEKGGAFSLSLTAPVIGGLTRRTALKAQAERESGITIIRGTVPSGVPREGQAVIFVALMFVALTIIAGGNLLFGLLLIPAAAFLYVPLHGDYLNSEVLLDEVQKTLKAKPTPPKSLVESRQAKSSPSTARTAKSTPSAAKLPKAKPSAAKPVKPRSSAAKSATANSPSAAKEPPTAPASEFPPTPDQTPAKPPRQPKPTPPKSAPRPPAAKPPAEKKPPAPPASEFPELPGEAPP